MMTHYENVSLKMSFSINIKVMNWTYILQLKKDYVRIDDNMGYHNSLIAPILMKVADVVNHRFELFSDYSLIWICQTFHIFIEYLLK